MELRCEGGQSVRLERQGEGYQAVIGERTYAVTLLRAEPGQILFRIGDRLYRAFVASDGATRYVAFDSEVYTLIRADEKRRRATGRHGSHGGHENLTASMHAQVLQVLVAEGAAVTRGQPLVVLEAMKMEIRVNAPHDGQVAKVLCSPGQVVERGQTLLELA